MNDLRSILEELRRGDLSLDAAVAQIGGMNGNLSVATTDALVDVDRVRRCGYPEVVYAPGKSPEAICDVFRALLDSGQDCLATRVDEVQTQQVRDHFDDAVHNDVARTIRVHRSTERRSIGRIAVVSAGTSDRPVAEEAIETAIWMGCDVNRIIDVGVAGPHRLVQNLDQLRGVAAVVVVAGMEGALPSVVAGHVDCPVIGVPTSVGYGAGFGGLSALLAMLTSCAANVAVVNIDAGFKGGYLAGMIAGQSSRNVEQHDDVAGRDNVR